MKRLFLISSILLLSTTGAFACRGTHEYPRITKCLDNNSCFDQSKISPEELARMRDELSSGADLHSKAHDANSRQMMRDSLKVLDRIKRQMK
jgi:hypothetical protein